MQGRVSSCGSRAEEGSAGETCLQPSQASGAPSSLAALPSTPPARAATPPAGRSAGAVSSVCSSGSSERSRLICGSPPCPPMGLPTPPGGCPASAPRVARCERGESLRPPGKGEAPLLWCHGFLPLRRQRHCAVSVMGAPEGLRLPRPVLTPG